MHDRRRRGAEGTQGKTHLPDVADVLPLELKVKAWLIIGDSPIELEKVIDSLIPQRVQDRTLSSVPSGLSRSSRRTRRSATNYTSSSTYDFKETPAHDRQDAVRGRSTLSKLPHFNNPRA